MAQLFNPRSLSPSASPLVSPLLRSPVIQAALKPAIAAQNRWSDPYALTAAIADLGKGYDAMNKSLGLAAKTQGEISDEQGRQDVQQAFQAALAAGYKPGTPEFELEMHNHLQTAYGNTAHAPKIAKARDALQLQVIQKGMLKTGLENHLAQGFYSDYISQHKDEYVNQFASPSEQAAAMRGLQQKAAEYARQTVMNDALQPAVDPQTGIWTVTDAKGNNVPIPPQLSAMLMKAGGDSNPWNALDAATKERALADANARANALAASQIGTREATAAKTEAQAAAGGFAPKNQKPQLHPYMQSVLDMAKSDRAAAQKALDAARKEGASPEEIAKAEKAVTDATAAYTDLLRAAWGVPAPAATTAPAQPPGYNAPTAPGPSGTITLPPGGPRMPTGDYGMEATPAPTANAAPAIPPDELGLNPYAAPPIPPHLPGFEALLDESYGQ